MSGCAVETIAAGANISGSASRTFNRLAVWRRRRAAALIIAMVGGAVLLCGSNARADGFGAHRVSAMLKADAFVLGPLGFRKQDESA
jgi:hypothetical protein